MCLAFRKQELGWWVCISLVLITTGMLLGALLIKSEVSKPKQPKVIYTGDVICD